MTEQIKGIVIRTTDYKDADKMVSILTADRGKIAAQCRGVRRKSSKLSAAVTLFTYCSFVLFQNGNSYTIDEADIEVQFHSLSSDIEKVALASYFAQLAGQEQEQPKNGDELLRLMLNLLYALDKDTQPLAVLKCAFELRCAAIWGFAPTFYMGTCCKTANKLFVSTRDGAISCPGCGVKGVAITKNALAWAHNAAYGDMKKIITPKLDTADIDGLYSFCQGFILDKLEFMPTTLEFYNNLLGIKL